MVTLTPPESSTLALIAQFSGLLKAHPKELDAMMGRLGLIARRIAECVIDPETDAPKEIKDAAEAFRRWHQTNLRIGEMRRSRHAFVDRRKIRQNLMHPKPEP
jgi:hypothetical protein